MKNLYIIGAGDLGRELESWIDMVPSSKKNFKLIGYLDKDPYALKGFPSNYKILGNEDTFNFKENDVAIIAIQDTKLKNNIYNKLKKKINLFSFISPNAIIGKYVKINEGSIICPNVILTTNIIIGKCVLVNIGSQVGHDSQLGDFSTLAANVDIAGNCNIGKNVFIGSNAVIAPFKKIHDNVKVGLGSVVINDLKIEGTYFGNPAKMIFSALK